MMIDILRYKLQNISDISEKVNIAREFLQIMILKSLSDHGYFQNIAFLGGTALRIVHKLRRYSEDLDFSIVSSDGYKFTEMLKKIKYDLEKWGFNIDFVYKEKTVHSSFLRFSGILQELGLSKLSDQKLSIKLEIDTNPPQGFTCENFIINDDFLFAINVFDLSSLMAGKLHAILFRGFTKGRDRYDLLRYLTKGISPNEKLFQNACQQNGYIYQAGTRKKLLGEKIQNANFNQIQKDVAVFLFDTKELELLNKDVFLTKI